MPFNTKADNDVITATFWNANVRDQVVSTVTSSTRPAGIEGQFIYETDTDRLFVFNGSVWMPFGQTVAIAYTLTISGTGWGLGNAVTIAEYMQIGRLVYTHIEITWGSTSTFGAGQLVLSVPGTARRAAMTGNVFLVDSGTGTRQGFGSLTASSTNLALSTNASPQAAVSSTAPHTWAATDVIIADIVYETTTP
jgi:hypothetical protein